ncbi:MAG: TlpA family protein disulfide reductase [Rikenellaceae bacterium]|nr:TlpA family protein disulfide reductase [Rikenellaceae bacterium]
MLDFWSNWCGPYVAAFPELKEAAIRYEEKLTVIGISHDEKNEEWKEALTRFAVPWLNLHAPRKSELNLTYGVNGIPHQVWISPEGTVIAWWTGFIVKEVDRHAGKYLNGQ